MHGALLLYARRQSRPTKATVCQFCQWHNVSAICQETVSDFATFCHRGIIVLSHKKKDEATSDNSRRGDFEHEDNIHLSYRLLS